MASLERIVVAARRHASLLASLAFVMLTLATAYVADHRGWLVYSLNYWHYLLYGLAYYHRSVSLRAFKRDAVLMKTVALTALGYVYLAPGPNVLSLAIVAAGFLLNMAAAWALGSDRTYYGQEIAALSPRRIAAFPYSWLAHPMLVGNVTAFSGLLLDGEFRRHWWPLAAIHVLLNVGLLAMELFVRPRRHERRSPARRETTAAAGIWRRPARWSIALGIAGGVMIAAAVDGASLLLGATVGLLASCYASMLYRCYTDC